MSDFIDIDNPTWLVSISSADHMGSDYIILNRERAEEYNKDPAAFKARHIGVSKDDYLEYLKDGPVLECKAITKKGIPCSNGEYCQFGVKDWIEMHKTYLCPTHRRVANASRNSS